MADALAASRRSCRASLIAGDIHLAQGEVDEAIRAWQGIESQNPDYLSLAAERLLDAYERQGRAAEGVVLLRGYLRSYPQLELLDVLYPKIAALHGDAAALEFLRETVRGRPSLTGLGRLIEAQLPETVRERGLNATSVNDLCAHAGVSKGAFFHHFDSKDALMAAAALYWGARANVMFDQVAPEAETAAERVLAYIDTRTRIMDGTLAGCSCFAGTSIQEGYANPVIRDACAAAVRRSSVGFIWILVYPSRKSGRQDIDFQS